MASAVAGEGDFGNEYQAFDELPASHGHRGVESFMSMLDDASDMNGINLSMPYEHFDDAIVDEDEVADEDVIEDEDVARSARKRTKNFTVAEDQVLVLAWESITLDAITETDQDRINYLGRIEDHYYRNVSIPSDRSQKSLNGRWTLIQDCCNRWSACVAQVNRIPPSGAQLTDHVAYCQARYKDMPKSKGKTFNFHHCWELLKNNPKWIARKNEAPPRRPSSSSSCNENNEDGAEEDGSPTPTSSRPDGRKKENKNEKLAVEMSSCREKLDEMIKASREVAEQAMKTKLELEEQKKQDKLARWQEFMDNEEKKHKKEQEYEAHIEAMAKRKADREDRRLKLEEIAEETKIMLMDPTTMDVKARAFWEMRRDEILVAKKARMGGGDGTDEDSDHVA